MGASVWIKAGLIKKAPGCDDAEYAENDRSRSALGKISDVPQVLRFLTECIHHRLSKTLKVSEG